MSNRINVLILVGMLVLSGCEQITKTVTEQPIEVRWCEAHRGIFGTDTTWEELYVFERKGEFTRYRFKASDDVKWAKEEDFTCEEMPK